MKAASRKSTQVNQNRATSIGVRGNGVMKEFSLLLPKKPEQIRLCAMKDVLCTIK
jgi:hypothetical protein